MTAGKSYRPMDLKQQLYNIKLARMNAFNYCIWSKEAAFLISSLILGAFSAKIGSLLFIIAVYFAYKKFADAARLPCPVCQEPFGNPNFIVLSLGKDQCQHCGQPLDLE